MVGILFHPDVFSEGHKNARQSGLGAVFLILNRIVRLCSPGIRPPVVDLGGL